jgi:Flp pilus assembly protein TadD
MWVRFYRSYSEVRFVDILLPNRWDTYRQARGEFYIKQAQEEIRQQKWAEALLHLRAGVAASPTNAEGRLVLVQFLSMLGRIELARDTLLEGLDHSSHDDNYLKSVFGFLLQYQEDEEIRRIAARLLPAKPEITPRTRIISMACAMANFYRGRFDEAEQLIQNYELLKTNDGRLLMVRIEWDRGHRDFALKRLSAYTTQDPNNVEFYTQLINYHRELGHTNDVSKYALLCELSNPQSSGARINLILSERLNQNTARYASEVDRYLRDFSENQSDLLALANFGTQISDADLTKRTFDIMQAKKMDVDVAALMVAESAIVAGKYQQALDWIRDIGLTRPEWSQRNLGLLNGLKSVAYFGLQRREDGNLHLDYFLTQPDVRSEQLNAIATRLLNAGARPQARRLLAQAVAADPRNQTVLTRLVEVDIDGTPSTEVIANLKRLMAMRRPAPDLLKHAREQLASDRFMFIPERESLIADLDKAMGRAAPAS